MKHHARERYRRFVFNGACCAVLRRGGGEKTCPERVRAARIGAAREGACDALLPEEAARRRALYRARRPDGAAVRAKVDQIQAREERNRANSEDVEVVEGGLLKAAVR